MNILLIDTTLKRYSTYVPLALLRLSAKHKLKGDSVELINAGKKAKVKPDVIYFSLIFLFDYKKDIEWVLTYRKQYNNSNIVVGGISVTLIPEKFEKIFKDKNIEIFKGRDLELEKLKPDFDIANLDYSYGFTMRGCPNKCDWCVVPRLEGKHNIIENWKDTIDTDKKVFYSFDNNILACGSRHFENVLEHCHKNNIKIDCNQGMDAQYLHKIKKVQDVFLKYPNIWKHLRFAWDSDRVKESIIFVFNFLYDNNIRSSDNVLYMLYDTEDSPEIVYERIKTTLSHKVKFSIKLMRFKDLDTGKLLRKWGGIGDLFADSCQFAVTGIISKEGPFWDYMFKNDFDSFINKATLIRQYIQSVKNRNGKKNTQEFIEFAENQLSA